VLLVQPLVPTERTAHHIRALLPHRDVLGVPRRAGEEWLVTVADTHEWLLDVTQETLGVSVGAVALRGPVTHRLPTPKRTCLKLALSAHVLAACAADDALGDAVVRGRQPRHHQ
jgi:hypothetical protein